VVATILGAAAGELIGTTIGREVDEADRGCLAHSLEVGTVGAVKTDRQRGKACQTGAGRWDQLAQRTRDRDERPGFTVRRCHVLFPVGRDKARCYSPRPQMDGLPGGRL
jgi:hypothetical protein